jgi:hypothetical protein
MALCSSSRLTSSLTNDWRVGKSNAETRPRMNASTYTCHSWTTPVSVRMAIAAAWTVEIAWITNIRRRLGKRSAITPAKRVRTIIGVNWSAVSRPRSAGEPCRSTSTSHACAVRCSHEPVWETNWPKKYRR